MEKTVDERGQRGMARLVRTDSKATITQMNSLYNCGEQKKKSQITQQVEPCIGWVTPAEDHIGFHSYQPRTEINTGSLHWTVQGKFSLDTLGIF